LHHKAIKGFKEGSSRTSIPIQELTTSIPDTMRRILIFD